MTTRTETNEKAEKQKPTIGRQVRFTRREEGGDPVVYTATISGVRPAEKAEEKEVTGAEREEILDLHRRGARLEDHDVAKAEDSDELVVTRRFPRPASPELVDLHVLVPNPQRPVQLIEAVPFDAKGEQDHSWHWPARE